ncbi:Calcineurin-like phosphoesterase-like protein 3 [Elsinoe fawcettii]|nr:Calcineurin-like phosphoesterase-like protein 3 [Elsinoe fawcettii]
MTSSTLCTQLVVTDLIVCSFPRLPFPGTRASTSKIWRRVEKDLYLHGSQQEAWLYLALVEPKELAAEDLWVTDIHVGRQPPSAIDGQQWESRHCGIWLLRQRCSGTVDQAVTDVAVLYGTDAVDPRPQWTLLLPALQLVDPPSDVPIARLSVHHGAALPIPLPDLQVRSDGTFKILQISDAHMVAGVGVCIDAIDAKGEYLPNCEADPLTARFMEAVLDIEQPDLVVLTGDQIHHDTLDSQTALFKVTAPMIRRHIPFTAVFGNHDDEGRYALSRT